MLQAQFSLIEGSQKIGRSRASWMASVLLRGHRAFRSDSAFAADPEPNPPTVRCGYEERTSTSPNASGVSDLSRSNGDANALPRLALFGVLMTANVLGIEQLLSYA